ncbi:MAG TPA: hypothetical protein VEA16_04800 [Vicinamibacterales bacterium]|nr:hypothetical protein [Vicinamibacterales bacterium]
MSDTDPKAPPPTAPHVLTVEDLWALSTYDFTVINGPGGRPCIFKLRRMDLLTQLMEDVINAPLLKAAMDVIADVQAWIAEGDGRTFESAFQNLDAPKRRTVLEQLQHYAVKVVLTPKLTLDPASEPDAFPVTLLGADTLFGIWNHTPPTATVPRLSEVAAEDFRSAAGAHTH